MQKTINISILTFYNFFTLDSIIKGKMGYFTKIYVKIMQDKCLNDMQFY